MATSGSFDTSQYNNRGLHFSWWRTAYSISNNRSTIAWKLVGNGSKSGYYISGAFKVVINGVTVYSNSDRINLYNGTEVASGTLDIYHNDNGEKYFDAYVEAGIYTYAVNVSGKGGWYLDKIDRYLKVTNVYYTNITETSVRVNWSTDVERDWTQYSLDDSEWLDAGDTGTTSGAFNISGLPVSTSHTLRLRFKRKDNQLWTEAGYYYFGTYDYPHCIDSPNFIIGEQLKLTLYNPLNRTFSISIEGDDGTSKEVGEYQGTEITGFTHDTWQDFFYSTIPNSKTGKYKVKVTYDGVTKTRNNGNTYTINENNCIPNFSDFSYRDTNANITNILGTDQMLVKGLSNLEVTISKTNKMIPTKSANPNKYIATIDTLNSSAEYVDSDLTFNLGTVINAGTKRLTVTAYDSRTISKAVYKDVIIFDYNKPVINVDVTRLNNFEAQTTLKVTGSHTKIIIDNVDKNTIKSVQYRYREQGGDWSSWTTLKTTVVNGNFTCTDVILSLDNTKAFDVEVQAIDNFDSNVAQGTVDIGEAIFFISTNKKTCYINGEEIALKKDTVNKCTYISSIDLNSIKDTIFYYCHFCTNAPTNYGYLLTECLNDNYIYQRFTDYEGIKIYTRVCKEGVWSKWYSHEKGVVLYENESGNNGATITLSESIVNFKEIEVHYEVRVGTNYSINKTERTSIKNGNYIALASMIAHSDVLQLFTVGRYLCSGTTLQKAHTTRSRIAGDPSLGWDGVTTSIYITRVVGYK